MRKAAILCATLVLGPQATAQTHSAEAVTSAILTAFAARDVAGIAAHSNAFNETFFNEVTSGERDGASVFNGVEGRAAAAWDGLILPARYRPDGHAVVPFAIEVGNNAQSLSSGASGRYIAVILSLDGPEDDTWGIDDLNFVHPVEFLSFAESR